MTTNADDDILFTMLTRSSGDWVSGVITDSRGTTACFVTVDAGTCQLGAAGVYTITLSLYYGGAGNYSISVDSMRTPSDCRKLSSSFFSFASPGLTGTLPFGSAGKCFAFDQPQGAVLYMEAAGGGDVEGPIMDGQYQPACIVRYATTCTLSQPGPYHVFLHNDYGNQSAYLLRMPRISASEGCGVVQPGAFGDQGGSIGVGTLSTHVTCNKLTTAIAGMVSIRVNPDQNIWWTLYDNAGQQVCDKSSNVNGCPLSAAGDYTLLLQNQDIGGDSISYTLGVTALYGTAGCAAAVDTSWDLPALLVQQTSGVQVNCQPFHGQAGDRVVTYAAPTSYNDVSALIVDGTGSVICPDYSAEDGCVLPTTGTYRVVSYLRNWDGQTAEATYKLQIKRLSSPDGCPTITPGTYDAAPAGAMGGIRCRILDVPAAGSYVLKAVDGQNYETYAQVYDSAGLKVCSSERCDFTAPGRYTMVLDGSQPTSVIDNDFMYAVAFLPAAPSGCPKVSDDPSQMTPYDGQFTAAGQFDCLQLASPSGARITELMPGGATGAAVPPVTVVDATGTYVCDSSWSLRQQPCELIGTAPFYAVYTPSAGDVTGAYALIFPRVNGSIDCPVLPRTSDGATVTTSIDRFGACFSVPADQHAAKENFTYERTSGSGSAALVIISADGIRYCGTFFSLSTGRTMTCTLPDGPATVILETEAVDATYQLTHSDATTTSP